LYPGVQGTPDQIDQSPANDSGSIRGVVKRDDEFVIWVDPAIVHSTP